MPAQCLEVRSELDQSPFQLAYPHYVAGNCIICHADAVALLLDFGWQALSNRFLISADEREHKFPFALGQCAVCGLIQFIAPISPGELKGRFDWLRYNEAEGHLDELVSKICKLPGVSTASNIGAISFKDDSTVFRFQKLNYKNTWRMDLTGDLHLANSCAGLETIQAELTLERAHEVVARRGLSDVLIVRHILEHSHTPHGFARALKALVRPGGYLVFEVPDCTPALTHSDYTMLWEEHIAYFTPATLAHSLHRLGFQLLHQESYPYGNENSLVGIVQIAGSSDFSAPHGTEVKRAVEVGVDYATRFMDTKKRLAETLDMQHSQKSPVAIFGAGHLSCAWINFLHLEKSVGFVVDDHPKKRGLFMAGSRLPICSSSELIKRDVSLCLTTLSSESEAKVIANNQLFLERGGVFASIFPGKINSFSN